MSCSLVLLLLDSVQIWRRDHKMAAAVVDLISAISAFRPRQWKGDSMML